MMRDEYDIFEPIGPMPVVVDWGPGNTCNFSCNYCSPHIHDGSMPWHTSDDSIRFINFLWDELCKKDEKHLVFNFHGGEPTLWPALDKVCTHIKSLSSKNIIRLITNGTRGTQWWIDRKHLFDAAIVSIHHGQTNKEKISEKFNIVQTNGIAISLHIMMDIHNFDECVDTYNYLYEHNLNSEVKFKPLRYRTDSFELQSYSDEQRNILNKLPSGRHLVKKMINVPMKWCTKDRNKQLDIGNLEKQVVLAGENNWKDWYCNIGIETVVVGYQGNIRPGSLCFDNIKFGHISDAEYSLPFKPVKCTYTGCYCMADLQTTKRKYLEPGEEFIDASIPNKPYKITTGD